MKISLINYIPLIVVGCFLLTVILGVVVLWPKYQELGVVQKNIAEKEKNLEQQEQYFLNLDQIKEKLEEHDKALVKISSALPDDASLPSLLNFIQKASSQSGLVLKGISPFAISSYENIANLQETQLSVQVFGSYPSFKNLLSILEESSRIIQMGNVSFSSPKEGDESLFTFNVSIKVYSY
ncbi:MAG: type 4a pilus biogenesis protein PilO [bacterium]